MRVLLADDNSDFRESLAFVISTWGYECLEASNGIKAWQILQRENAPRLALLDWTMPGMSGLEVCRKVRETMHNEVPYLILVTGRSEKEDLVAGLEGGADEYLIKPVDFEELQARLKAGRRIVELQSERTKHVRALTEALARVKQLHGMLPICAWCKKIRNDQNYWQQVEDYITAHSEVSFSHGICPECSEKMAESL
jgi:DNA-binding response OmpR family regulator